MKQQTVQFEMIRHTAIAEGYCSACGRKTVRQRTFEQAISPSNRNKEGKLKTRGEIRSELIAAEHRWTPNHDHMNCPEICAERVERRKRSGKR